MNLHTSGVLSFLKNALIIFAAIVFPNLRGLVPALIVSALTIIGIASAGVASYLLIIMIPLTILSARILWKKGVIRVETVKEDK